MVIRWRARCLPPRCPSPPRVPGSWTRGKTGQVGVMLAGHRFIGVTQRVGDHRHGHTLARQPRAVRPAQIVIGGPLYASGDTRRVKTAGWLARTRAPSRGVREQVRRGAYPSPTAWIASHAHPNSYFHPHPRNVHLLDGDPHGGCQLFLHSSPVGASEVPKANP